MFKNFIFIIGLILCQLFSVVYGQNGKYRGTYFGRANFDFSVPFVFLTKYESLKDVDTLLGDYYYDQFSVPFHVSLELAYLATFLQNHRLLGLWKIKYSDDPINFIFDDDTKSKLNATQFSSKNLNNIILLRYIWSISASYELSPSFSASFDLNRGSRIEEFTENFYNAQIYSLFLNFKMKNLGNSTSQLQRMIFDFDLGYSYNYLPNSELEINLKEIPNTKEDFHSLDFDFKYFYSFYPNFFLDTVYKLNFKLYAEKAIHSGIPAEGYTDNNQKDLKNNLDLILGMGFIDQGDYRIIDLVTAFSVGYLYSTHVEYMEIKNDSIGDFPLPSSALFLNNSFYFYQEDFKNYFSGITGIYLKLNFNANHALRFGYTFSFKRFTDEYAKKGRGLSESPTVGSLSTSGGSVSTTVDSYGVYIDEKRLDMFNTFSFGYAWKSEAKDRQVYPYFGFQKGDSNDQTKKLNRYIFVVGMKVSYEF